MAKRPCAQPGCRAVVTSGMMRFAQKDEELALIIGHELAHNHLGHMSKKMAGGLLGIVADVAVTVLTGIRTTLFQTLGQRAYSQAYKSESDYAGIYTAARAGFSIEKAPEFWRRMSAEHPGSVKANFLATHPSTPERFLALEKAVKEIARKRAEGLPLVPDKK